MPDDYKLDEVVARTRRIETRLTSYLEAQGHDTKAVKPTKDVHGTIIIQSLQASLADILEAAGNPQQGDQIIVTRRGRDFLKIEVL